MNNINDVAHIAAQWWTDVIIKPKFDAGAINYEQYVVNVLCSAMVEEVEQDKKLMFYTKLKQFILGILADDTYENRTFTYLDCDYSPSKYLSNIANECNISLNNFPIKTTMWLSKHYVAVRYGYGSDIDVLFYDEEYCNNKIKDINDYINDLNGRWEEYYSTYMTKPKEEYIEIQLEDKERYIKMLDKLNREGINKWIKKS